MNKKAFTLSADFLTGLIIAVVVLVLAVFALTMFIGKTLETKEQIDAQLQADTDELLTMTNEKVVIPIFKAELKTGQTYVFALGIKNYLEQASNFTVHMKFLSAYSEQQQNPVLIPIEKWIFEKQGPYEIAPGEKKIVALPVRAVSAEENVLYVFEAYVTCTGLQALCNPYGYKQQIEVNVIR